MGAEESGERDASRVIHRRFGEILRKEGAMLVRVISVSSRALAEWRALGEKYLPQLDQSGLLVPRQTRLLSELICSELLNLELEFEYFPLTLRQEIQIRAMKDHPFSEEEARGLLLTLLRAAASFERLRIRGLSVMPGNVLLNDQGQVRLVNVFTMPGQKIGVYNFMNNREVQYIAPEELKQINYMVCTGNLRDLTEPSKADSFSIGATLLEVLTLQSFADLVTQDEVNLDLKSLSLRIQHFKRGSLYSEELKSLVAEMLRVLETERRRPSELLAELELRQWSSGKKHSRHTMQTTLSSEGSQKKSIRSLNVKKSKRN